MRTVSALCLCICLMLTSTACGRQSDSPVAEAPHRAPNFYLRDRASQVRLILYDPTGEKTGETFATYLDGDIVAAPLSTVRGCHSIKATPLDRREAVAIYGYTSFDYYHDVVLLRIGRRNDDFARRRVETITAADTLFAIEGTYEGRIFRHDIKECGRQLPASLSAGMGVFNPGGSLCGMIGTNGTIVPAAVLDSMLAYQPSGHSSVYDLRLHNGRSYISYRRVAGFDVRTSMGSFTIRLYDDVPEYRDNFIRLVSDGYYDSLLVHRVLTSFLIQTGAADSKYAKKDDVVGWQGPGYTLPMVENQKHFHKRGAVAASKLPQDRNARNRCDGGQFYIVSGRVHSSEELDKIAFEYHKSFSARQRQTYTTVGGAPHLDDDYVVFGEVTKGMNVVDRIAAVRVDGDRPVEDIRVYSIRIIKR